MEKMIQVNIDKCIGCRTCEVACSLKNLGQSNPNRSRIRIIRYEKAGQYHNYIPMVCQQCSDPLCVESCPVKALSRNELTGAIEVDQDNCVGCRVCTITCPIGGISIDPVTEKAAKCDLCGGDPACVKYCHAEAIKLVPREMLDITMKRAKSDKMSELFALMQSLK